MGWRDIVTISTQASIMFKLKHLAIIEGVIILLLLGIVIKTTHDTKRETLQGYPVPVNNIGLLSPRVYSKILEPGSLTLINFAQLRKSIADYITKSDLNAAVYVENFKSGASFGINERKGYSPASLSKVLIAIFIMKKVEKKELSLDTMIDINESDRTESAGTLYLRLEKKLSLRVLLRYMLNESDNTALKTLERYTSQDDRVFVMNYIGYYGTEGYENSLMSEDNNASLVTPKLMYNIFSSLYLSSILQPEHSEFILSALVDTVLDINKIAGLPDTVVVAHKFGSRYTENRKFFHDCGIMYIRPKNMRLFYCIMTKDLDKVKAVDTIGLIVHAIYSYSVDLRDKFDYYRAKLYEIDAVK